MIITISQRKWNKQEITNNSKRHNHNNYEHNVKLNAHIKHINNYDTEISY